MQAFTVKEIIDAVGTKRFRELLTSEFRPEMLARHVLLLDAAGMPAGTVEGGRLRVDQPVTDESLNLLIAYDRIVAAGIAVLLRVLDVADQDLAAVSRALDDRDQAVASAAAAVEGFTLGALLDGIDLDGGDE